MTKKKIELSVSQSCSKEDKAAAKSAANEMLKKLDCISKSTKCNEFSKNYAKYNDINIWVLGEDTKKRLWVYHTTMFLIFPIEKTDQAKIQYLSIEAEKNYTARKNEAKAMTFRSYKLKLKLDKVVKEFTMPPDSLWIVKDSSSISQIVNNYIESDIDKQFITALKFAYKNVVNITPESSPASKAGSAKAELDELFATEYYFTPAPCFDSKSPLDGDYFHELDEKIRTIVGTKSKYKTYKISVPDAYTEDDVLAAVKNISGIINPNLITRFTKFFKSFN